MKRRMKEWRVPPNKTWETGLRCHNLTMLLSFLFFFLLFTNVKYYRTVKNKSLPLQKQTNKHAFLFPGAHQITPDNSLSCNVTCRRTPAGLWRHWGALKTHSLPETECLQPEKWWLERLSNSSCQVLNFKDLFFLPSLTHFLFSSYTFSSFHWFPKSSVFSSDTWEHLLL